MTSTLEPVVDFPHAPAAPPAPCLVPFDDLHAARVAAWVQSDQELTWLAPATPPPLTAAKVADWGRDRPLRLLFAPGQGEPPVAYAELNPMPADPRQRWIGHFIVDPACRRRGLGLAFMNALLHLAFRIHKATSVFLVVFTDNPAAIRCYEQAGFRRDGFESRHFPTTGRTHRFLRMRIDAAQFRNRRADKND